ncbi:2-hydroxyisoflavanone dehydratase [Quillaja saponaria]|uniref:2-hydroxyisoflavanone dehydratase n=1 Tax=Quillaja saponaria TaxID=32244 RepID=A0AAD7VLR0_QUISA|nr:2-hydroxyisoflavanone dehydratase [Quillaja saponaria]
MDSTTTNPTTTTTKEIAIEIPTLIRTYKDGTVERLFDSPIVPPSLQDPDTGVSSKDITISDNPSICARLFLPKLTQSNNQENQKIPILVYFHGGGFCIGSAFSSFDHRYLNLIVSQANVLAVSVEYRLAPEHLLPAAYEDCWTALKWVTSHLANNSINSDPWLLHHGDLQKIYLGGDSAGANIVHNIALRTGVESLSGGVKVIGAFLSCPYFWGSKPIGSEPVAGHEQSIPHLAWNLVYPDASGGIDNPMINPLVPGAPSLAGLGCSKLLVIITGKDVLRDRGVSYFESVKKSGWKGELELFEVEDEDHCFHMLKIETANAKNVMKRLASFLQY